MRKIMFESEFTNSERVRVLANESFDHVDLFKENANGVLAMSNSTNLFLKFDRTMYAKSLWLQERRN
jgi:hypothetical protein